MIKIGRINTIWNPEYWKICFEGKSKIIENDIIYKLIIGDGEDYQYYEITEFISKDNYDNIIKGNYFIKCFPYAKMPILLFDERQELTPLVIGCQINFDELSKEQNEYINNLKSKKKLRRI